MNEKTDVLNDFVAILKDGIMFYESALEQVDDKHCREMFRNMIALRNNTILKLAPLIESEGDRVRVMGTLVGTVHEEYTKLTAMFNDPVDTFLGELAALEDRTLNELEESIKEAKSSDVQSVLFDELGKYRATLQTLKRTQKS